MNKTDRLDNREEALELVRELPGPVVAVSALTGEGMPDLLREVEKELYDTYVPVSVRLPFDQGQLISLFHDQGQVETVEHGRGGVVIEGNLPGRLLARYQPYLMIEPEQTSEDDLAV